MAQELELSDCTTKRHLGRTGTDSADAKQSERKLLRIGILTLGVLCIIQATLNVTLHLAVYLKEDTDQFHFNFSLMAELCQIDQSQQNSNQFCSCCNCILRRLLREYEAMGKEVAVSELFGNKSEEDISGYGTPEEFLDLEMP